MVKTLLRGLLLLVVLLLLATAGGLWYLDRYLNTDDEKLLQDLLPTAGLHVAFRRVDVQVWDHFPRITVTIDSLVLRDTLQPDSAPPMLQVRELGTEVSLAALLRDTMELRRLHFRHGSIYLASDSSDNWNVGDWASATSSPNGVELPPAAPPQRNAEEEWKLRWDGLEVDLQDIDFTLLRPSRNKHIAVHLNKVQATGRSKGGGVVGLSTQLDLDVDQLAFNTDKGAYLKQTSVRGPLDATFAGDDWTFHPTLLEIGSQQFSLSADLDRREGALSHIYVQHPAADYEASRLLLFDELQEKLSRYHVDGPFAVRADIATTLQRGGNPEVTIDFRLTGQDVRLKQYAFQNVYGRGRLVNRLDEAEGGIPGSRKNLRLAMDSVRANYLGATITTDHGVVAAMEGDAILRAPLTITGPARAISDYLENRDFFFDGGRFRLVTEVDASLMSFVDVATNTDGKLTLSDTRVVYRPAGVRFPFREMYVHKHDQDVDVRLQSGSLPSGFSFELIGALDNLTPLLVDQPGGELSADVALIAPRISWSDFRQFFGEDGMVSGGAVPTEYGTSARVPGEKDQITAMKTTLRGLQETFHPRLEARFWTVDYYDVFQLRNFVTGLHFDHDTLVLERTSFDWAGSTLAFGARLDLAEALETPFNVQVRARHLNLNALRPSLDYFGLQLPAGLDSLPSDLMIRFDHGGRLGEDGIVPGHNRGMLVFDDGRNHLFSGLLDYAPGPQGLATKLHLGGDPQIVNVLFGSEDFFFGTGSFALDLETEGTPADLPELIRNGKMRLRVDSSRIEYRPGGAFIPVRHFGVDVEEERAAYVLQLFSDSTQRAVELTGALDNLVGFLYPEKGEQFTVRTDARAGSLHLSDLQAFVQSDTTPTTSVDTTPFNLQSWVSATGGVFNTFRPDLSLRVDTFWASEQTPLLNVYSGLKLRDSSQLVLEDSGFTLGEGKFQFAATYALDTLAESPFTLEWYADSLSMAELAEEAEAFGMALPEGMGELRGQLSMSGFVDGRVNEQSGGLLAEETTGNVSFELVGIELLDWPLLTALGQKAKMRRRFEELRFAPLSGQLRIDSGRITVPRLEVQSTGFQVFVEGHYDLAKGPNLLVSLPLRNVGRGLLVEAPDPTGYAAAGWKVYLVSRTGKDGQPKMQFRLGRRRYYKQQGRLDEWRQQRQLYREERRAAKKKR